MGPQVNFVAHMWKHERDKVNRDNGYLGVVARPGPFPIAMVNRDSGQSLKAVASCLIFTGL